MVVVKITKKSNGKVFKFFDGEVSRSSGSAESVAPHIPIPSDSAEDRSGFSIEMGTSKKLDFDWTLRVEDEDRSDGDNIKTFGEALNYLEEDIAFPGIGAVEYEIEVTDKFRTTKGLYKFESFRTEVDAGVRPSGSFSFSFLKKIN